MADLQTDPEFSKRRLRSRHLSTPIDGMNRIARALVESPDRLLQELAETAMELCGADCGGISLEVKHSSEEAAYEWVATAGGLSKMKDVKLPRNPSACGTCLERGRPLHFRVSQSWFDMVGVRSAPVTDGVILPWNAMDRRGGVWISAHGRQEAFDQDDFRIMRILTDLAAVGIRQQGHPLAHLQSRSDRNASAQALERKFDHSLQGMRSALYMAEWSQTSKESKLIAEEMTDHLHDLSSLMRDLLQMPKTNLRLN